MVHSGCAGPGAAAGARRAAGAAARLAVGAHGERGVARQQHEPGQAVERREQHALRVLGLHARAPGQHLRPPGGRTG